jgi:CBS-domain-containing membrane protein
MKTASSNGLRRLVLGPATAADLMTANPGRRLPPAAKVVEQMLALHVHHLFVVDADGVLTGVISTLDVLRHLHAEARPGSEPVPDALAVAWPYKSELW